MARLLGFFALLNIIAALWVSLYYKSLWALAFVLVAYLLCSITPVEPAPGGDE